MHPFIKIFNLTLPLYGVCIVTGIFIAAGLAAFLCKKKNQSFDNMILIGTIVIAFGFIGAKLLFVLVSYPVKDFFKVIFNLLFIDRASLSSGFVFYGGLLLGIPSYFLAVKIAKCKTFEYCDFFAFIIPLVHGFGRIGCFCAGCCYGVPYEGFLAVHYTNPLSTVPVGIGIFPVQLVEACLLISLSLILFFMCLKGKTNLLFIYLGSYCLIRFVLEKYRFDSERGSIGVLSVSQFISLIVFGLTLAAWFIISFKNKKAHQTKEV